MFTAFLMEEGICKSYYPADCLGENIMTKVKRNKNITTFAEHLDRRYGKTGTKKRTEFEVKAKAFAIGEIIKEERRLASMTQEQLAG